MSVFTKKPRISLLQIIGVIAVVCIVIVAVRSLGGESTDTPTVTQPAIKKVTMIDLASVNASQSTVEAVGQVESLSQVELKSEVSSRISRVHVSLGDDVVPNQILVSFNNADLAAQLADAQAGLQSALAARAQYEYARQAQQSNLNEIEQGAREEELEIARSQVVSAQSAVVDAEDNIKSTQESAAAQLSTAVNTAQEALYTITDVQYEYFFGNRAEDIAIKEAKAEAISILLGGVDAGRWINQYISQLDGGASEDVRLAQQDPSRANVDQAIASTKAGVRAVQDALRAIPLREDMSDADIAAVNAKKTAIAAQLTAISNIESSLTATESALSNAQNALSVAVEQLQLTEAGATDNQIDAQEALVNQAEANLSVQDAQIARARAAVAAVQAQLAKTAIRSPIYGTIGTLPVRAGELVSPGTLVASVVNTDSLQVKAYIDSSAITSVQKGTRVLSADQYEGVVMHVAPSIDPLTKKVEVIVVVSDADASLVVGDFVSTKFFRNTDAAQPQLSLPLDAVSITSEGGFVYVIQDGLVARKPVILGDVVGERITVLSGLDEIDAVIGSTRGIAVGDRVDVVQ